MRASTSILPSPGPALRSSMLTSSVAPWTQLRRHFVTPRWTRLRSMTLSWLVAPLAFPKSRSCSKTTSMARSSTRALTQMRLLLTELLSRLPSSLVTSLRTFRTCFCLMSLLCPLELRPLAES
uniref:(northern house mosquito) hypothetical protein n=1 Tax=Culex pipiens TaxID=7175 RepID=A0A8D8GPZ8_CULPI